MNLCMYVCIYIYIDIYICIYIFVRSTDMTAISGFGHPQRLEATHPFELDSDRSPHSWRGDCSEVDLPNLDTRLSKTINR